MGWAAAPEVEIEKWVGAQLAQLFEAQYGVVRDPLLTEWLQPIASATADRSPRKDLRYSCAVLDSDQVNAFSLPGGYIFVTRGLLERAASDDEVAAVLAHEVGHSAERHAVKGFGVSLALAAAASQLSAEESRLVQALAATTAYLLVLHQSRRYENQADQLGLLYSYEAGYDPEGLVQFLQSLKSASEHPGWVERLLRTHPPTPNRIARARASPLLAADNREAMWRRAGGLEERLEYGRAISLYQALWKQGERSAGERLAWLQARAGREQEAARICEALGVERPQAPAFEGPIPQGGAAAQAGAMEAYRARLAEKVGELRPRFCALKEHYRRITERNDFNKVMDDILLLSPVEADYHWLALLGAAKWVVQQVSECLLSAERLDDDFVAAVGHADLLSARLAEGAALCMSGDFLRECDLTLADLGEAAAQAERCERWLAAAAADITPVVYALLDPSRWGRRLTTTEALGLEALAYKAVEEGLQAAEGTGGALQAARRARIRILQQAVSVRWLEAVPTARQTMFEMATARLRTEPATLRQALEWQGFFGGAVALVAVSKSAAIPLAETRDRAASVGSALEVLAEQRLPLAGLYTVLAQLERQSRQALQ